MNTLEKPIDANTKAILETVIAQVLEPDDARAMSLVDIGCGEGRLLEALAAIGWGELAGVGWGARMPDGVTAYEDIDLSQAGWASCFTGKKFDWVVSTEVLEHLVNPYQFLVELRRTVADSGRLLLTFPNVHNWRSIVGYALDGRFSGFFGPNFNLNHPLYDQHIFIPNHHLVRYFLQLTGFEVETLGWINGRTRLTAQTTLLIARPVKAGHAVW